MTGLPPRYLPRVAGHARGPWIEPRLVTPTEFRWRNARTFVAEDDDGVSWRVVRVTVPGGHHYGWWAVELLGVSLMGADPGQVELIDPNPGTLIELADGRIIRLPPGWKEVKS